MMLSRGVLVFNLLMSFLCMIQLDAASIVSILYTARDDSLSDKATLEVGQLELHLQGTAFIDYNELELGEKKRKARFIVKNVDLSDESFEKIAKIHNSKGLGYTVHLTATDCKKDLKNNGHEFVIEFIYDPQQVKVAYTFGDVMNGNGSFIITLQNKRILRALDMNHESILRLAHDTYYNELHLYC